MVDCDCVPRTTLAPPPPNAHIVELERKFGRNWDPTKPPQASDWTHEKWVDFSDHMQKMVKSFWKECYAAATCCISLAISVGLLIWNLSQLGNRKTTLDDGSPCCICKGRGCGNCGPTAELPRCPTPDGFYSFIFVLLAGIVLFCLINQIVRSTNQGIDKKIHALCNESSDASVTLTYATQYTDPCKPKRTKTYRAVYICRALETTSSTTVGVPQAFTVSCPAGSKPGDAVQIMTPSGPMQVTIPAGITQGMTFQVQQPAAGLPVAQATIVEGQT